MAAILCPKCDKNDMIQKVTAIMSGIAEGKLVTPSRDYYIREETDLQKKLKLPDEPKKPEAVNGYSCVEMLVLFFLVVPALLISVVLSNMWFTAGTSYVTQIILFLLIMSPGLLAWLVIDRRHKKYMKQYRASYASEKIKWELANDCWNRSYYCYRDGIVFDPKTNETCEPDNFQHFVYQTPQV